MHTNSPRETGVRRYRIIVGSYKIGKRAKEKRAELEPRQNGSRQSEMRQTDARQSRTRQCGKHQDISPMLLPYCAFCTTRRQMLYRCHIKESPHYYNLLYVNINAL